MAHLFRAAIACFGGYLVALQIGPVGFIGLMILLLVIVWVLENRLVKLERRIGQ